MTLDRPSSASIQLVVAVGDLRRPRGRANGTPKGLRKGSSPDTTHGTGIYADQARGGARGVNVGILYGSPMECLGHGFTSFRASV